MNIRVALILWLLNYGSAQDANCDFYQQVLTDRAYSVMSPGYPNSYRRGAMCRWILDCPIGYNCRLECADINLPQTQGCTMDKLLVSRSGDPTLSAAETYCGRGSLSIVSTGQRLTIGLITSASSPGGRFSCEVTAQQAAPPQQCRCGERKQNRIVGGQETGVNEYKMMAGLYDPQISQIKCGATIVTDRFVLTAAHCVVNKSVNQVMVVVGGHDVNVNNRYTRLLGVDSIIIHPGFTDYNYNNDIALVRVNTTMQFNDGVGPVCLPFKYSATNLTGYKATVLGWGTLFPGGPTSNVLRKVDLDVISQPRCRTQVATLTDNQICTLTPGKDACQDDSGSPGLITDSSTGLLFNIFVVSYGRFCASNEPGVNTRVTSYLNWIISNTQNYNFCIK